jgi:alpha/beta superfamily hydrolase
MHNKVTYQAAKTLHRFGLPVARFNFRGVGRSGGTHDNGAGEVQDVSAVIDFLANAYPGVSLLVAGFSFGSWVGSRAGCADTRVTQLIGLGLPVADADARDFSYLDMCEKPKLLVTGEFDRFGPPHTLRSIVERFSASALQQTSVQIVRGADHFFTGHLDAVDRAISEWLQQMNPGLTARDSL